MRFDYLAIKAVAIISLASIAHPASAQSDTRAATRIDSLRATHTTQLDYLPAVLTFANGRRVSAWLTYTNPLNLGTIGGYITCLMGRVHCYETNPETIPRPELKAVSVERLALVEVNGPQQQHRYEMLKQRGKALGILAESVVPPGPLELFGYAEIKRSMLASDPLPDGRLPMPGGIDGKLIWYTRLRGGELQTVPRGRKAFATAMSQVFAAYPELAVCVQQLGPGTNFNNLPALVREYNDFVAKQ